MKVEQLDLVQQFMATNIPMWVHSTSSLEILQVNVAAANQYGYNTKDFLALTTKDLESEKNKELHKGLKEGNNRICIHQSKKGESFYVHLHSNPITYNNKPATLIIAYAIDDKIQSLLENKVLEQNVRKCSVQIERIMENITDGFFAIDRKLRFTFANKQFCKLFNCKSEQIIGKSIWTIFTQNEVGDIVDHCIKTLHSKEKISFTDYYQPLNAWYSMSVYPSEDGISIYFKDISKEKMLQNTVANERLNLTALINNTEDMIWSIDKDFQLVSANDSFLRVTQIGQKKLQPGESIFSNLINQGNLLKKWKEYYKRALEGETYRIEYLTDEYNYQTRFYEISFNPIRNYENQIIGVGCFSKDITRKKKHEFILAKYSQLTNMNELASAKQTGPDLQLLNIINQFDFENPRSNENHRIINILKEAAQKLESVILQVSKTPSN